MKQQKADAWKTIEHIEEKMKDKYLDACGGWLDEMLKIYKEDAEEYNEALKIINK